MSASAGREQPRSGASRRGDVSLGNGGIHFAPARPTRLVPSRVLLSAAKRTIADGTTRCASKLNSAKRRLT